MIVKADEYADFWKLDSDTAGTALEMVIRAAQKACEHFCGGRQFEAADHTEHHTIYDTVTGFVYLRHAPVSSVTSVTDDAQATDGGDAIASTDYILDSESGKVTLAGSEGVFTAGELALKVIYRGGYEPDELRDEPEIWLAVMLTAGALWNDPDLLTVASEVADGASATAHSNVVPPVAQSLLMGYRRIL